MTRKIFFKFYEIWIISIDYSLELEENYFKLAGVTQMTGLTSALDCSERERFLSYAVVPGIYLHKLKILRMIHLSWEQSRWNHLLIVGIEVWIPGQIVAHAQCWERSDAMMAEPDQHWPGEHKVLRSWQYVNADQQPANPSTAFDCSSPLRLYDPRKLWNMSGENGK